MWDDSVFDVFILCLGDGIIGSAKAPVGEHAT
jgi:hypothetical protein